MTDLQISELVRNWAIVLGGAIGIALAYWRGLAFDRQSRAQRQQAAIAQRAHLTEVFKDAVGQLGDDRLEIRLGAVLSLVRIVDDFPEFERPVADLLAAYVREKAKGYAENESPTAEIVEIMRFIQTRSPET